MKVHVGSRRLTEVHEKVRKQKYDDKYEKYGQVRKCVKTSIEKFGKVRAGLVLVLAPVLVLVLVLALVQHPKFSIIIHSIRILGSRPSARFL